MEPNGNGLSMSDWEIKDWLKLLNRTILISQLDRRKGTLTAKQVVCNLLAHANEDGMTEEDRKICRRALTLLN